jgi:hypothetical protein
VIPGGGTGTAAGWPGLRRPSEPPVSAAAGAASYIMTRMIDFDRARSRRHRPLDRDCQAEFTEPESCFKLLSLSGCARAARASESVTAESLSLKPGLVARRRVNSRTQWCLVADSEPEPKFQVQARDSDRMAPGSRLLNLPVVTIVTRHSDRDRD